MNAKQAAAGKNVSKKNAPLPGAQTKKFRQGPRFLACAAEHIRTQWQLYIMVTPLVIWLILYAIKPLFGVSIAFLDYNPFTGMEGSKFIGLDNFIELIAGPSKDQFWRAFRNTVIISVYGILFVFPFPILLALMFHELRLKKYRQVIQTIVYAPHFISQVIVCSLVITMLAMDTGIINILIEKFLMLFGVEYNHILFMSESRFFRAIYILSDIWKEAGFSSIVFFAALCGVPVELYEAAKVDGANRLQQIWHISIPGIMSTIIIMLIIRVGNILNVGYEKVLLLYNTSVYETADILSTFTYRIGVSTSPDYGLSTASSLINSVVGFAMVVLANRLAKKFSETSMW